MEKELKKSCIEGVIYNTKFISFIFVVFIIGLLYITGPANAFITKLIIPSESRIATKGETINLNVIINPEDSDINDISYINFIFKGPLVLSREYHCSFYLNGTKKSSDETCKGISISISGVSPNSYGYSYDDYNCISYGYNNNCIMNYTIKIDTNKYYAGEYESQVEVITENNRFETEKEKIIINPEKLNDFQRCSVRAYDGNLYLLNKTFTNNKLSFYVSTDLMDNKIGGRGSLSGQKNRERFSYRFKIDQILENDENHALLYVSGDYRVGIKGKMKENALLYFDKIHNKISIAGERINIPTMYVSFRKDC